MVLAFTLRFLIQVWINICVWYEVGASITISFVMWHLVLIAPHAGRNSFSLLNCFVEHWPLRKRLFTELSWEPSGQQHLLLSPETWVWSLGSQVVEGEKHLHNSHKLSSELHMVTCAQACVCMHAHAYSKYKHFPRRVCLCPPSSSPRGCQLQSLDLIVKALESALISGSVKSSKFCYFNSRFGCVFSLYSKGNS